MPKSLRDRINDLEDELKQRDRRISDLNAEITRLEDLVTRQAEAVEDYTNIIQSWIEGFGMVQNDRGEWTFASWLEDREKEYAEYRELKRTWNAAVSYFNAAIPKQRNVGRPLAASEAQVEQVRKLHKQGMSLRGISDETSLGLRTVRSIVDQPERKDRTSRKYLERIRLDNQNAWKARKRTRDSIPKRLNAVLKTAHELKNEASGLTR